MTRNMGSTDRAIRTTLALALLIIGIGFVQGVVGVLLAVVAAVLLATSAAGWCPLYRIAGLSTCPLRIAAGRS